MPWRRQVPLRVIWVVRVVHPNPVWMPGQVVLCNPCASTLRAAAVQVACHRVRVLLTLTLLRGLHPLDGVALRLDADAASILEDDHHRDGPQGQEGGHDPHGP